MKKLLVLALALWASGATAQNVQNHAIPLGKGPGVVGWGKVGPCAAGQVVTGTGASTDPICDIGSGISIIAFGGKNDGTGDNGPACTAALQSMDLARGGTLVFPPGTYNFTTNCTIPAFQPAASVAPTVTIIMSGAVLRTSTSGVHIFDRVPPDQTAALNYVGAMINFHDGLLIGSGLSNQIGINLGATYSSRIMGTDFQQLGIGLNCQFCLEALVMGSKGTSNVVYDWLFDNGSWSGAGTCSAQSNNSTLIGVRSYSGAGMTAALGVHASSGVSIQDSVFEGANPVSNVDFDDKTCTTVKTFYLKNLHLENVPTGPALKFSGVGGGTYTLIGIEAQATLVNPLLDATGLTSTGGQFNIYDIPLINNFTNPIFKITAAEAAQALHFTFTNFGGPGAFDVSTAAYWDGAHVPTALVNLTTAQNGTGGRLNCGNACYIGPGPLWQENGIRFLTDNTHNIGFDATQFRPANVFVGTGGVTSAGGVSSTAGNVTGNNFVFNSTSGLLSTSGGGNSLTLNASGSVFAAGFLQLVSTRLEEDTAHILAQRFGANAQTFRVYNTFTSGTNYERGVFDWTTTANALTIGTEKGSGGGTARNINLVTDGNQVSILDTNRHIRVSDQTAPALTSCGTNPSIIGTDEAGEVTMGTGAPTGCIITFNIAYVAAPLCVLNWQATPLASQSWTVSNTAITTVQTATSSNKLNYICRARNGG